MPKFTHAADGGPGTKDKPEAPDGLHVGKQVHQGDQTHAAADSGAAEAEDPFLVAGAYRRQRHDEAGDHRCIDARIIEPDESHVADQRCQ